MQSKLRLPRQEQSTVTLTSDLSCLMETYQASLLLYALSWVLFLPRPQFNFVRMCVCMRACMHAYIHVRVHVG